MVAAALALVALHALPAVARAQGATSDAPARRPMILVGVEKARADSARLPYTEADVRFMTTMIGHHAQAIEMSRLAPARDASPAVRTLAARIINAQQDEIAIMQSWLRDRARPVPEVAPSGIVTMPAAGSGAHAGHAEHAGHAGMNHGAAAHAGMPGMLGVAELAELANARGRDFDRLFLTRMIQHHRGATTMVRELFATPGAGQDEAVFRFASDVNVDQTTEIARMQRMLLELMFQAPAGTPAAP